MTDRVRFSCVIGLLLVSVADLRWVTHGKVVPCRKDLAALPLQIAGWSGKDLPSLTAHEEQVLAADKYIQRVYGDDASHNVVLFVAYYGAQRSGDALHSPKNCLPGAGWEPVSSSVMRFPVPADSGAQIEANHYVIEKGGARQDVLYWYQAHGRTFASEYLGKFYLVWDGISKGRTDGALIRITAAQSPGKTDVFPTMVAFAKDVVPVLRQFLPD